MFVYIGNWEHNFLHICKNNAITSLLMLLHAYFRAKFSEITKQSVERALSTLGEPDKAISDAVDVRSELDLRIGTDSVNIDC